MASLTLYGSSNANGTLTNAGNMSNTTGGTETSKISTAQNVAGNYCEVWALGGTSTTYSAIQSPTGRGWVYKPGAGSFASGNWSLVFTLTQNIDDGNACTARAYQYSGTYTSLGSNTFNLSGTSKSTYTVSVSCSAATFAANDLIYIDCWFNDPTGVSGDTITVYESSSGTAGVANDVQVTTSSFSSLTNNSMASTDALSASDIGALQLWPLDALTISDIPGGVLQMWNVDALTASDIGNLQLWPLDSLSAADTTLAVDSAGLTDGNQVTDLMLGIEIANPTELLSSSDIGALQLWPIDSLSAADASLATDATGLIENNQVADLILEIDVAIPIEPLSAADASLASDTAGLIENNQASDLGALQTWNIDSLATGDSGSYIAIAIPLDGLAPADTLNSNDTSNSTELLSGADTPLFTESAGLIENNQASDLGALQQWVIDTLTALDALAAVDNIQITDSNTTLSALGQGNSYVSMEGLTVSDAQLALDGAFALDGLNASDNSGIVIVLGFTEGLVSADNLLSVNAEQSTETLNVSDASSATAIMIPVDALSVADIGNLQQWLIDALATADSAGFAAGFVPLDSQAATDNLVATNSVISQEVMTILDVLLGNDSVKWLDSLTVNDLFTGVSIPHVFIVARTRDGIVLIASRDGKVSATARDGIVIGRI